MLNAGLKAKRISSVFSAAISQFSLDDEDPFYLPPDQYPRYGSRHGILIGGNKFRTESMGLLLQRGFVRMHTDESAVLHARSLETTEESSRWLGGIFLAEDGPKDAYVFRYDGAKRRRTQVDVATDRHGNSNIDDIYQYRTHTMQSGTFLYDASDTERYPNGQ